MTDLWTIGSAILAVDVANPVLLAVVVIAVASERPYAMSLAVIAGHTVAYFAAGVLVLYGLADLLARVFAPVIVRFSNPQTIDYVISVLVGLGLLWVALRWKVDPPNPVENPPVESLPSVVGAFGYGAVVNFIGIPFALPYFAFLSALMRADGIEPVVPLAIYNIGYAAPFLLLPLGRAVFGTAILPLLNKVDGFVAKYSAYIMPVILGLGGLFLIADAGLYFVTGIGLI